MKGGYQASAWSTSNIYLYSRLLTSSLVDGAGRNRLSFRFPNRRVLVSIVGEAPQADLTLESGGASL